jgi:cytochrome bd-I ubiquinol oxidase subunit X
MWYFSWVLGVSLVCVFSLVNALWYEINQTDEFIISIKKKTKKD